MFSIFRRFRVQVSLATLLLLMALASTMAASVLYASRVPAIRNEWSSLTGQSLKTVPTDSYQGRSAHLTFLLFTLTSPLLLAGGMATALNVLRLWKSRRT